MSRFTIGLAGAFAVVVSFGVTPPYIRAAAQTPHRPDLNLVDLEASDAVKAWSSLEPSDPEPTEPAASAQIVEASTAGGKHTLRITFAGGTWPAITTTQIAGDWELYRTFKADVTVNRACVVGFRALQQKSRRDESWDGLISRWVKTAFVHPGTNTIVAPIHPPNDYSINARFGRVIRFEIFMYEPHKGESIEVGNIRLSDEAPPADKPRAFRVVGTDLIVNSAIDLEKKLKDQWKPPEMPNLEQAEASARARFQEIKTSHPHAVFAVFRDGQAGYDAAHPDAIYAGWTDARWTSHGPDGMLHERAINEGHNPTHELFMRHRAPLMRVDLSAIPPGAHILSAQLLIQRANLERDPERDPAKNVNVWIAEPCNRPWNEYEVNAFRYAKDRFWKEIGGMSWDGGDPDFYPLYFNLGPGQGNVNLWDCTELVKFWTDGAHPNHGFMLHCSPGDWMLSGWSREAPKVENRPALFVIYKSK